jgi:hypothetical protein
MVYAPELDKLTLIIDNQQTELSCQKKIIEEQEAEIYRLKCRVEILYRSP